MDILVDDPHYPAIGILDHFLAFTRPEPLQVGHFLYPVLPPVLRVRFVTFCLTFAIVQISVPDDKGVALARVYFLFNG